MPLRNQPYSNPQQDEQILQAWQAFLRGNHQYHSNDLRPVVGFSWQRCHEAKVDPNQQTAPILSEALHDLHPCQRELLEASLPVMQEVRAYLAESGSVMALADAQARMLRTEGDARTLGFAENIHFIPGASWSEPDCGTNAIGTALAIGHAIQVHSAEHYCEGIKRWTCSAAVIRSPVDRSIVGAVDISGLSSSYVRQNLALAVQMAGRIESRLMEAELQWRYRLLDAALTQLNSPRHEALLLFDRNGRLLKVNDWASKLLIQPDKHTQKLTALSLKELTTQIHQAPSAQSIFNSSKLILSQTYSEVISTDGAMLGTLVSIPVSPPSRTFEASTPTEIPVHSNPTSGAHTADSSAFDAIIGQSHAIKRTIATARQLAPSSVPILLLGETGTGKEVFARAIHDEHAQVNSKKTSFIAINCGGMSRELLSSELFGYAEGAFTGARKGGMLGKIEAADGGTLFLDEIGEMPLDLQSHFLRVLEGGEVYRLGETRPHKVHFRLVAATHRNLQDEVRAGRFRMDLFYRIAVTTVAIPALRERRDDIPLLIHHYLQHLAKSHGLRQAAITRFVTEALQQYDWPGNVRELRNTMESMLLTCRDSQIELSDLPCALQAGITPQDKPTPFSTTLPADETSRHTLLEDERESLLRAIRNCNGNLTAVAKQLGIAKSTVYLKIERHNLLAEIDAIRRTPAASVLSRK